MVLDYRRSLRARTMICKRRRRLLTNFVTLSVVVASMLSACGTGVDPHPPVRLRMAGSTSMESLVEELAEAYGSRYDYVTIDIDPRGSALGLEALRDGTTDMALVSRELTVEERQGLQTTVVAYDAIAVVVNGGNAVESLSLQQLRGVFGGEILGWSELGGEEVDLQVVSREDGSGTREVFEKMVMGGDAVTLAAMVAPGSDIVGEYVARDPVAIGYASVGAVPLGARPLRIEGVEPDPQAMSQGDYPLVRPFVMVTEGSPDEEVQAFLDFVLGPAGQVIVGRRYGRIA